MERIEALKNYYETHNVEMDNKMFKLYMSYHLSICERSDMIGATNHMLDIFRKE